MHPHLPSYNEHTNARHAACGQSMAAAHIPVLHHRVNIRVGDNLLCKERITVMINTRITRVNPTDQT